MALPPLASIRDFEERLGRSLTAAERRRAEGDLRHASALVRAAARQTWVDTSTLELVVDVADLAVETTIVAAMRHFENPDGMVSETAGPLGYRRAGGDANAGVFLTPHEEKALRGLPGGTGGMGSIQLTTGMGPGPRQMFFDDWGSAIEPWAYPAPDWS